MKTVRAPDLEHCFIQKKVYTGSAVTSQKTALSLSISIINKCVSNPAIWDEFRFCRLIDRYAGGNFLLKLIVYSGNVSISFLKQIKKAERRR